MFADFLDELTGRGFGVSLGIVLGGICTWIFARWKRYRDRLSILRGNPQWLSRG